MSVNSAKIMPHVALLVVVAIGVSYFVFLYASWNQFQKDRINRDSKIDELLERLPKKSVPDVADQ